jgi:hypothetical protein
VIQKYDDKEIEQVTANQETAQQYKEIIDLEGKPLFKITGFEVSKQEDSYG